jgi:hypothetical protein
MRTRRQVTLQRGTTITCVALTSLLTGRHVVSRTGYAFLECPELDNRFGP